MPVTRNHSELRRRERAYDLHQKRNRLVTSDLIGDTCRFNNGDWAIMDRHRRKGIAAYAAKLNRKAAATKPATKGFA